MTMRPALKAVQLGSITRTTRRGTFDFVLPRRAHSVWLFTTNGVQLFAIGVVMGWVGLANSFATGLTNALTKFLIAFSGAAESILK